MNNLPERLRHMGLSVAAEAADEIERLRGLLRDVQTDVMRLNRQVSTFGIAASICQKIDAALAGTASQPTAAQCTHWWTNAPNLADVECKVCGVKRTADNQSGVKDTSNNGSP